MKNKKPEIVVIVHQGVVVEIRSDENLNVNTIVVDLDDRDTEISTDETLNDLSVLYPHVLM